MKKAARIRTDHKGAFIFRHHFVRGKQKLTKVYLIDGIPSDEIDHRKCYLENADDITLLQDGEYEELHNREQRRNNGQENDEIPF